MLLRFKKKCFEVIKGLTKCFFPFFYSKKKSLGLGLFFIFEFFNADKV